MFSGGQVPDPFYQNASMHNNLSKPFIQLPLLTDCTDQANAYRYLFVGTVQVGMLSKYCENKLCLPYIYVLLKERRKKVTYRVNLSLS